MSATLNNISFVSTPSQLSLSHWPGSINPSSPDVHTAGGMPAREHLDRIADDILASLPTAADLSTEGRRGILARYTAVLEGNFIYWMTGAYLAVKSESARAIIIDNLLEEVRDSHPAMLRKFALAAHAAPNDADTAAIHSNLLKVRLFIGRGSAAPIVAMMAFFEGFLQRLMPYLADLAERQGSEEFEYTDVHGVCDIAHSDGLFRALDSEVALSANAHVEDLFEGVYLLQALFQSILANQARAMAYSD